MAFFSRMGKQQQGAGADKHASHATCSSTYRGVTYDSRERMFRTRIHLKHLGKRMSVGRFPTEREAALAYDCAALLLHRGLCGAATAGGAEGGGRQEGGAEGGKAPALNLPAEVVEAAIPKFRRQPAFAQLEARLALRGAGAAAAAPAAAPEAPQGQGPAAVAAAAAAAQRPAPATAARPRRGAAAAAESGGGAGEAEPQRPGSAAASSEGAPPPQAAAAGRGAARAGGAAHAAQQEAAEQLQLDQLLSDALRSRQQQQAQAQRQRALQQQQELLLWQLQAAHLPLAGAAAAAVAAAGAGAGAAARGPGPLAGCQLCGGGLGSLSAYPLLLPMAPPPAVGAAAQPAPPPHRQRPEVQPPGAWPLLHGGEWLQQASNSNASAQTAAGDGGGRAGVCLGGALPAAGGALAPGLLPVPAALAPAAPAPGQLPPPPPAAAAEGDWWAAVCGAGVLRR
ncbi:MAG: hypothetical protein J3K34DRAFT_513028 [Monoraphidium minutum]|nr:MAG: hypothetical protein J3K34DRAFT_513028 [Monoraphidium minutum]